MTPTGTANHQAICAEADTVAEAAARSAGVSVWLLRTLDDLRAVCGLYDGIWGPDPTRPQVTVELLRALTKAGNYVAGAFDVGDGQLVGACVGFFGTPARGMLHSHIAGVAPKARGRGVGRALKTHQRAWALRVGVSTISWTFDPLVSRNAHFNIVRLAAEPVEYLTDFYGGMHDRINGSEPSDRLLVTWHLTDPEVQAACGGATTPVDAMAIRHQGAATALAVSADGWPTTGAANAPVLLVAVPRDITVLRASSGTLAREWRIALRDVLGGLLASGCRVTGFDRDGWYVVEAAR